MNATQKADVIWEIFQGLGALAGLVSGVYLLIDRWFAHYPTAFLAMGDSQAVLRVENRASQPIIVRWKNGIADDKLRFALDPSMKGIFTALVEGETVHCLDVSEVAEFWVVKPGNYDSLCKDAELMSSISWQFAQPKLWKPWREIPVRIKKEHFGLLRGEDDFA